MAPIEGAFPLYSSETAALVVSGIGKAAAAASTAYLHARTKEKPLPVFLNVGVAGHATRLPGAGIVAHTVIDDASGERWYPTRLLRPAFDALEVRTVTRPETAFGSDACYDMEASGFYPIALRFSVAELVQCIKIVSDNRSTPAAGWSGEAMRALVEHQVQSVAEAAESFRELASELDPLRRMRALESVVDSYREEWRFTTSQSRALLRLLTRWEALEPGAPKTPDAFASATRASDVIERLSERLRTLFRERPL
jgi:hypothetical protein